MLTRQNLQHHTTSHVQNIQVIKVGGENALDLRTAAWLAEQRQSNQAVVPVISALRTKSLNTTSLLLEALEKFNANGIEMAKPALESLFKNHIQALRDAGMHDSELEGTLRSLFESYFPDTLSFPADLLKINPDIVKEQVFIGYGEIMSAQVLSHILRTRHQIENTLVLPGLIQEKGDLGEILKVAVSTSVSESLNLGITPIVPGYRKVFGNSILSSYGRGYTDKMAERVAVGLSELGHHVELHIQKQVPLLSSNPNNLANTKIIENLSYPSAAEITGARGANAQVLNEHTITPDLANARIPIHVYNPFSLLQEKSIISAGGSDESKILFVDGRDHVSTITVSGFSMSASGILAKLTNILADQGISIDSISSSETEVTLTTFSKMNEFEKSEAMRLLNRALGATYDVNISNNLGMIYCIGDNLSGHPGILEKITGVLAREGIDIECISQSRGQRSVTLGVASHQLKAGIAGLHEALIDE